MTVEELLERCTAEEMMRWIEFYGSEARGQIEENEKLARSMKSRR